MNGDHNGKYRKRKKSWPALGLLYKELRNDILSNRLRDGTKLSETYICKKYKVSRTPAREALFQLEAEGLILLIPNRGAFVNGLSRRDISDIFEMRCIFEIQAAEWAIRRMSSEDADRLGETVNLMEFYALRNDADRILQFDEEFHKIISDGAGNRMLRNSINTYRTYLRNALPSFDYSEEQLKELVQEHKDIYMAFEAKNPKAGRQAMEEHLRKSRARFMADYIGDYQR